MLQHARFGQRLVCLRRPHGPSIVATTTSLLFLLLLGGNAPAAAAEASSAYQLPGTSWTATSVQGQDVPADVIPLLRFREPYDYDDLPAGTMYLEAVFHPCFYSMDLLYEVNAASEIEMLLGAHPQTKEAIASCPFYKPDDQSQKDALVDASQSFFDALTQVKSFTITIGVLELHDALGVTIMELITCETESQLAGTGWHPYVIYPPNAPAISLTQEQQQTMTAKFQGCSVGGNAGCNSYSASYKTDLSKILLGGTVSTEVGCEGDVMALESAYIAALGKATAYKMSMYEETLDLIDATTGDLLLSFASCAAGPATILGVMWEANGVLSTARNAGMTMKMTFQDNGTLKVQTACLEYEMEFMHNSSTKTIFIDVPKAWDQSGESACEENVIEREKDFLEALGDIASFDIALCSGTLRLKDTARRLVLGLRMADVPASAEPHEYVSARVVGLPKNSNPGVRAIGGGLVGFGFSLIVPLLVAVVL